MTWWKSNRRFGKRTLKIGAGVLLVAAAIVSIFIFRAWQQPDNSLLPVAIREQMSFTPYFYKSAVPLGYSIKSTDVVYSKDVLSVRLTKQNSADITISQQLLPSQLRPEDVLTGNRKLSIPFGVGTLNQVEGRWLGSIITNDPQPVLILISSQSSENEPVVANLAEALSKAR